MSLQGLMSGADCAIESNPLSQVMKHADGDRSLQQDRIAGPSSSRLHYLPGTTAGPSTERDVQLARQFFDGPVQGPAFALPHYLPAPAQFQTIEMGNASHLDLNSWNDVSSSELAPARSDAAWSSEFRTKTYHSVGGSSSQQQNLTSQTHFASRNQFTPSGMYNMGTSTGTYMSNMGMYNPMMGGQTVDKGKGKLRQEDFESAFAQAVASLHQTDTATIEELSEEGFTGLEDAMTRVNLENVNARPQEESDFNKVWDQLQKSDIPPSQEDIQKWEAEFRLMDAQRQDGFDFENVMNSTLGEGYRDFDQDRIMFDNEGIPNLGNYVFEQFNQYLSTNIRSLLDEAKRLLHENGSLSEAALLLEAAIQNGELGEGGYEAWILLGETRNMDEREEAGIKALTEGVRRAQEAGANGAGMMALAISYTNESYERAAHTMLLRWLSMTHPAAEIPPATWESLKHSPWHSHEQVSQAFLNVARAQHSQGIVDPDVQTGLGVLFYTANEFDRAKDCFEAALSVRPMDYQLWNRLGSCLSNGDKHEESLGAYREALNLRPTYVRAISNVAVACLNIGAFQEAAEHLLSALSMQNATAGETSDQLWFTLRRVFLEMNRPDMADLTNNENRNVDVFRNYAFEF